MAKVVIDVNAKDNASAVIGKAAKNYADAGKKIMGSDEAIKNATKEVSRVKMESLTLSQKMKFAIAKEAAAGNKLQTNIVSRKEKLAKLERQLRSSIKHGDDNVQGLAKQVAAERKQVQSLEENTKAQKDNNETKKRAAKILGAIAAGATAAAAGIFLLAKRAADMGDDMIKSAQRLGLTVEQYQRLGHAMKISGTTIEEHRGSMVRFSRTARDASVGVKLAKDAFDRLGVSVKDSDGKFKGSRDLILEVSENFRNMPQSVEKTAIAMDLFGRSGSSLTQFLNLGSAGIVELGDEAERLGGVMSTVAAQQGEEFVDALTRMATAAGGVTRVLSEEFQPVFTRVMEAAAKSTAKASSAWKAYIDTFKPFAKWLTDVFITTFKWVGKAMTVAATGAFWAWEALKVKINDAFGAVYGWRIKLAKFLGEKIWGMDPEDVDSFNAFKESAKEGKVAIIRLQLAAAAGLEALDGIAAAALNWGNAQRENSNPATDEGTKAIKRQSEALKEQREALEKIKDPALVAIPFDKDKKKLKDMATDAQGAAKSIGGSLGSAFADVGKAQSKMAEAARGSIEEQKAAQEEYADAVKNSQKSVAASVVQSIKPRIIDAVIAAAGSQAGIPVVGPALAAGAAATMFGLLESYLTGMNKGGIVPGSQAQNKDSVLGWLTPGELVLPRDMASDLLRVAGKTGSGQFNEGGRVGRGGAGVVVNFNDGAMVQRSPAELDRFVRDRLVPSLTRLRRQGAFA